MSLKEGGREGGKEGRKVGSRKRGIYTDAFRAKSVTIDLAYLK